MHQIESGDGGDGTSNGSVLFISHLKKNDHPPQKEITKKLNTARERARLRIMRARARA